MGARINFIFKDVEDEAHVVLYSHWGETEWQRDLAQALLHAKPRWSDASYFTRMAISWLMQDSLFGETGFGIYAVKGTDFDLGDLTIVIDVAKETVYEAGKDLQVDWDLFIRANLPALV